MTPREVLKTTKHFYPGVNDPCIVKLELKEIKQALDSHYLTISTNIIEDCLKRFEVRGYILSINERCIYVFDGEPYDAMIKESMADIKAALRPVFNCATPDFLYCLCNRGESIGIQKAAQFIIDRFRWKVACKMTIEVIYENETSIT